MAYRNKTFVSFASEDIHYYRLMCAWRENEDIDFDFHNAHDINVARDSSRAETIRRRLRERLANTKQVVMLIGDVIRSASEDPDRFVYYEVEIIDKLELPVVFANLNKSRSAQSSRLPRELLDLYTISVPFGPKMIKYALDDFPSRFLSNLALSAGQQKVGPYRYAESVYED